MAQHTAPSRTRVLRGLNKRDLVDRFLEAQPLLDIDGFGHLALHELIAIDTSNVPSGIISSWFGVRKTQCAKCRNLKTLCVWPKCVQTHRIAFGGEIVDDAEILTHSRLVRD